MIKSILSIIWLLCAFQWCKDKLRRHIRFLFLSDQSQDHVLVRKIILCYLIFLSSSIYISSRLFNVPLAVGNIYDCDRIRARAFVE